jgi:hypothetical protein
MSDGVNSQPVSPKLVLNPTYSSSTVPTAETELLQYSSANVAPKIAQAALRSSLRWRALQRTLKPSMRPSTDSNYSIGSVQRGTTATRLWEGELPSVLSTGRADGGGDGRPLRIAAAAAPSTAAHPVDHGPGQV